MNLRTTIALLFGVLLLAGAVFWQLQREKTADAPREFPLFEGVERGRVDALRIEDVERGVSIRIERDASGRWMMTDPQEVRAEDAQVEFVLKTALERTGKLVPGSEADAAKLGFEPPHKVLELEEQVGGKTRRTRLELGALDPDGQSVNVRANGRLMRTWRDIDTSLALPTDEFRSHRLLDVDASQVVEVHRTGSVVAPDGKTYDMRLDAFADGGRWRATAPVEVALDPLAMALWSTGLSQGKIDAYVDPGTRPLSDFGLDPPEGTVQASNPQGTLPTLRLGRPRHDRNETWMCSVEGQRWVYGIETQTAALLLLPFDDLLDHRFVRVAREGIEAVELDSGARRIELSRAKLATQLTNRWSLRTRSLVGPDESWSEPIAAERTRVEDLFRKLDELEFVSFDHDAKLEGRDVRAAIHVRAFGERLGGVLGAPFDTPEGAHAVLVLRDGDQLVARADASLFEVATQPIEALASLGVQELLEVEQKGLTLTDGTTKREFVRGSKGLWVYRGFDSEARELRGVLDPLLFLRASRHLRDDERVELVNSITVTFQDVNDVPHTFVVGEARGAGLDGKVVLQKDGRLSLARDQDLLKRLGDLLKPR